MKRVVWGFHPLKNTCHSKNSRRSIETLSRQRTPYLSASAIGEYLVLYGLRLWNLATITKIEHKRILKKSLEPAILGSIDFRMDHTHRSIDHPIYLPTKVGAPATEELLVTDPYSFFLFLSY